MNLYFNSCINLINYSVIVCAFYYLYKRYVFPRLLNYFMKRMHASLHNSIKKKAFNEAFKSVEKSTKPIEILEIGVGTGENFKYFPQNANISFTDKTDAFLPFLQESLKKQNLNTNEIKLIVTKGEDMKEIESNSKDVIVHTFILCSVYDPQLVLNEIHRILKPGGFCVFIEHSLNCDNLFVEYFQKIIGPIWFCLFDCRFRPMKNILEAGKYQKLKLEFHRETGCISSFTNPIVYGIGTKL